jgi:SH3-like domain-containing protein
MRRLPYQRRRPASLAILVRKKVQMLIMLSVSGKKVALRESPEEKGKYLTSVNLAEKVELLGEEKTDESASKKREYCKIKLMDGKEGWIVKDFIVAKAKPGVMVRDVDVYTRPDLLAKSNKTFKRMDIVAVSDIQSEWCKITGKRTGGTWIDEGWVKISDLSYDQKDIAVAMYGKQALVLAKDKQIEELIKIIDNSDFVGSVFIDDLKPGFLNREILPNENPVSLYQINDYTD